MCLQRSLLSGIGALSLVLSASAYASDPGTPASEPAVEPQVKTTLQKMVNFFEGANTLTFKAFSSTEDVSSTLQKLQFHSGMEGAIERPNKVYLKKSGFEQTTLWYDGATLTILDRKNNKYAKVQLAGDLKALVAKLDDIGVETPFTGLIDGTVLKHVDDHVFKGDYYGATEIDGKSAEHLALRQDAVDWQLWTDTATGAPKKVVITSKMLAAAPEHELLVTELKVNPTIDKTIFQANLPADATEVPVTSDDSDSIRNSSW